MVSGRVSDVFFAYRLDMNKPDRNDRACSNVQCPDGGIGRRSRLALGWLCLDTQASVRVRIPLRAPFPPLRQCKSTGISGDVK